MEINNPINIPKHNPVLMALSNIIIFGAAYLVLHLYARFFIIYGLMFLFIVLSLFVNVSFIGPLSAGLSTLLSIALFIYVIIDTHIQTKKIVDGKRIAPTKKRWLTIFGVVTIIAFVVVYFGARIYVEGGLLGPDKYGLREMNKQTDKRREQILSKYTPLQDEHCNSLRKDQSLVVDNFYGNAIFTDYCYFKKAVETNNPLYCGQFHESSGLNGECIAYLAIKNQKPELCTEMATYEVSCSSDYYDGIHYNKSPMRYPCSSDMPESIKQRCLSEFAEFEKTLQLK